MEFIEHQDCNDVLTPGKNENTASLPVARGQMGVFQVVRSYWVPTPDELKLLLEGGCVAFTVLGTTHPPIRADVCVTAFKTMLNQVMIPGLMQ